MLYAKNKSHGLNSLSCLVFLRVIHAQVYSEGRKKTIVWVEGFFFRGILFAGMKCLLKKARALKGMVGVPIYGHSVLKGQGHMLFS